MCLTCRRARMKGEVRSRCQECDAEFVVKPGRTGVFCSLSCRGVAGSRAAHLARWGVVVSKIPPEERHASRRAKDRLKCARRRMRLSGVVVDIVDPDVVFERDGWRCHICHKSVDRRLSGRDRMGPTLDHLIPLSAGGEHSYANTALAHRSCNSSRGARGAVQLALIG